MSEPLNNFRSIGQLAADFQAPVSMIRRAADEAGAVVILRLNSVDYFGQKDIDLIALQLANIRGRQMSEDHSGRVKMTRSPGQQV